MPVGSQATLQCYKIKEYELYSITYLLSTDKYTDKGHFYERVDKII